MGVPGLYGWLVKKFPKVSRPVNDFLKCENLYLDMNGIIHPCCRSDTNVEGFDSSAPDEEAMLKRIGEEVERFVDIANPSKVLFLAVDGVPPRAKLTQQRARRYRKVLEEAERLEADLQLRKERENLGLPVPPSLQSLWDSNVITPGTDFMLRLNKYLSKLVSENSKDKWKHLTIVLSDSTVPGEGEHKIMEFIRAQQAQEGMSERTIPFKAQDDNIPYKHCLVGDDADFVFLGLTCNEDRVCVLRNNERRMKQILTLQDDAVMRYGFQVQKDNGKLHSHDVIEMDELAESLVRKILGGKQAYDEHAQNLDFARTLKDIVLLSCLCGNDFLPNLSVFTVHTEGMQTVLDAYQDVFASDASAGQFNYMTKEDGSLDASNLSKLFKKLEKLEMKQAYKKRYLPKYMSQCRFWRRSNCNSIDCTFLHGSMTPKARNTHVIRGLISKFALGEVKLKDDIPTSHLPHNLSVAVKNDKLVFSQAQSSFVKWTVAEFGKRSGLKATVKDWAITLSSEDKMEERVRKAKQALVEEYAEELERRAGASNFNPAHKKKELPEEIKRHHGAELPNWNEFKDNSYLAKFSENIAVSERHKLPKFKLKVAGEYLKALQWVTDYYTAGIPCWHWVYPFHYSPFCIDIVKRLKTLESEAWPKGKPVSAVEQLMIVSPAHSKNAFPKACQPLVESPNLKSIYPSPFQVKFDPNGRWHKWQWVARMPPLSTNEIQQVSSAIQSTKPKWSSTEVARDLLGSPKICGTQTRSPMRSHRDTSLYFGATLNNRQFSTFNARNSRALVVGLRRITRLI